VADHPVKVPSELVKEWMAEFYGTPIFIGEVTTGLADRAAQWGADQELEACCEWVTEQTDGYGSQLRAARRPNPLSLAEQGLADFDWLVGRTLGRPEFDERSERIRAALNRLAELEANQ